MLAIVGDGVVFPLPWDLTLRKPRNIHNSQPRSEDGASGSAGAAEAQEIRLQQQQLEHAASNTENKPAATHEGHQAATTSGDAVTACPTPIQQQ